jgi:GNAT superfamily N-acetyltransferase
MRLATASHPRQLSRSSQRPRARVTRARYPPRGAALGGSACAPLETTVTQRHTLTAIRIRDASVDDVAALARHRAEMFRDMGQLRDESYDALVRASAEYFARTIPIGEYVAWVASPAAAPDTIVGGAGVQLRPMLPRPDETAPELVLGPEGLVVNVFTERPWRRCGVAELLMRQLLAWADARRLARLVLHASPEGRRLYEMLGFVTTNEMRRAADRPPP